ncbi:hypothetical protein BS78_01G472000 [Paspalum vaginatum]|nr:hypothetical protein BS78_01G472000 [Paspalum vaginatum]
MRPPESMTAKPPEEGGAKPPGGGQEDVVASLTRGKQQRRASTKSSLAVNQYAATKDVAPAGLLGNKKGGIEHFKTRFSVHRIRELAPDFNENQREWINEAGVGALLTMAEFSIPVKLVRWIMKHTDPLLSEFRFRGKF